MSSDLLQPDKPVDPKLLASLIHDNKQLHQFLKALKGQHRRKAYDAVSPHLSFKPKPFFLLNQ